MRQSLEILNVYNALTLKQVFWKTKTFFQKLRQCFLLESNTTKTAKFSFKTDLSEEEEEEYIYL